MIIKGNTVGTPMPRTNYEQTDPTKADYLKGKDVLDQKIEAAKKAGIDAATAAGNAQTTADNAQTAADNAQAAADNAQTAADNAQTFAENLGKAKAGFIYPLASAVVPDGFLLCDGAEHSRTEYPELFAAIGTMYGSGDGATTFNVPNLIERVPAGSGYYHAAGEMVGAETHKLTVEEMPSHMHELGNPVGYGSGNSTGYSWSTAIPDYGNMETQYVGGDQPHNNMQPTTYIYGYIIATGKNTAVSVADIVLGAQAIPLPLKYGGVGATDPKTARENLGITPENIGAEPAGAVRMELLWENASPTSDFAAQTVQIPLSGYDFTLIYVYDANKQSYDADGLDGFIIPVGKSGTLTTVNYQITYRKAVVSTSSVAFTKSLLVKTLGDVGSDTSKRCIPHYIYGIKGVSA